MAGYHINVFWSDEDGEWIAEIPDLPGCFASGATPVEAVREVQTAQTLWLEVAREQGRTDPAPRYQRTFHAG